MTDTTPYLAQVETTTVCNAKCPMCPQKRGRYQGMMDVDLFWSICDQAVKLGVHTILPFINGEPLMDDRMCGFVQGIADRYPGVRVDWYCNGSLLTEDVIRKLLSVGNIKALNVSVQGGNKETYERNTGLPWENIVQRVDSLIRINEEMGRPVEVRMNICDFSATRDSIPDFVACWGGRTTICIGVFSNFGGLVRDTIGEAPFKDAPYKLCARSQDHVYITWNGDVIQCCFDVQSRQVYGNVNETPLGEIWHSPKMVAARKAHREAAKTGIPPAIPVCRLCNSNRFRG